jgi:hypothetical protein
VGVYSGRTAHLVTQHRKALIVAPEFQQILNLKVDEVNLDTDKLGTFSGDVERVGSPRETVLAKARMAREESGATLLLASEGTIGADPFIPFINTDRELFAFIDVELNIELVEFIRSTEIIAKRIEVNQDTDFTNFLLESDFPRHHLILKASQNPVTVIAKGINSIERLNLELAKGFRDYSALTLENDFRAHCSPSRQVNIAAVARKIAKRLSQTCPSCEAPGWGVVDYRRGVECDLCGELSSEAIRNEILGCTKCPYRIDEKVMSEKLDPANCNLCNP